MFAFSLTHSLTLTNRTSNMAALFHVTFSLFHSEPKTYFTSICSSIVCFCLSDWSHGSRPLTWYFFAYRFLF